MGSSGKGGGGRDGEVTRCQEGGRGGLAEKEKGQTDTKGGWNTLLFPSAYGKKKKNHKTKKNKTSTGSQKRKKKNPREKNEP